MDRLEKALDALFGSIERASVRDLESVEDVARRLEEVNRFLGEEPPSLADIPALRARLDDAFERVRDLLPALAAARDDAGRRLREVRLARAGLPKPSPGRPGKILDLQG
jgi:hypothetical protein